MTIPPRAIQLLGEATLERFLRYVRVDTRSVPDTGSHPSSPGQRELADILKTELTEMGIADTEIDGFSYLYARLPASPGASETPLTLCAHLDTSPSVSGSGVTPVLHPNYDGTPIRFSKSPEMTLTPADSPELLRFLGDTIITAAGDTLLGADDKAGIAAIMGALAALRAFPELPHPELRIVFTPDEEIGEGADHIQMDRLGRIGYTVDGGEMGSIEEECFHAEEIALHFTGHNVHPGYAKNRMVNAGAAAARFAAALPDHDTPEHREGREGFVHLTSIAGDESEADLTLILRDFQDEKVTERREFIQLLVETFTARTPGLKIGMTIKEQYRNMKEVLAQHPEVMARALEAITSAGLSPIPKPIRGGTDGARLSFMGMPTPNLFAGGMLFHSPKEWIPATALRKSAETLLHLCRLWAEPGS
ncbi:MAG: peptidase T [Desulfobacterales bacterium]|jgi:tripeptide aminopeptidase